MKQYSFNGHLSPTPTGMLPLQMSGEIYLAGDVRALLRDAHSKLIKLAAELVRGDFIPSDFIDDLTFCKTTCGTERRRVAERHAKSRKFAKVMAIELRKVADQLSPPTGAPQK